ncbi:MAG: hypothetical protein Q9187_001261 [Circinaria calcarea]
MLKPSPPPSTAPRVSLLRTHAHAFCQAFLTSTPPRKILDDFFTSSPPPQITEHGPDWAVSRLPFLGVAFRGRDADGKTPPDTTCDKYFERLGNTLSFHPDEDSFPPPEEFIVDATTDAVSVVAKAKFKSVKTGKSWDETFIYRLSKFDAEGRIGHWEIWADPLSAWEAVGGV